jgi:glucosamine 6-phosphate synthetase-like amidotransferase/phosphosugar isomerase protein
MCGIVAYFGGAGNSLTRVLAGMSAIIYRAPDSTGIGLFGDDREPIRLRKSLGSVVQLLDVILTDTVYTCPEALIGQALMPERSAPDLVRQQQWLLAFEGFDAKLDASQPNAPDFDALVNLKPEHPVRLVPGCAGKALFHPEYRIRSRKDLSNLIQTSVTAYDLPPLMIHTLIRNALAETIDRRCQSGAVSASAADILASFDDLFEATRVGARGKLLRHRTPSHMPKPINARKQLWQCLIETVIRIPDDYNRDGVCCLFRLLDAALLSRMAGEPAIAEALDRLLDKLWLPSRRQHGVDWRTLYAAEKSLHVYGWAGATALIYLQQESFSPTLIADLRRDALMTTESVVPGRTDPLLLRYLATPIIAHGRWAMQAAVTVENAHPFMDARRLRAVALNGQFDSRVEARLRVYLESVGGYRLRSDNSAEYAALLWGHFYDQLSAAQHRSELVRQQVAKNMTDIAICGQSIDFDVYHRVRGRLPADLERMAFIAAVRQIVQNGGQVAVIGISLVSPQRLYVASHNRPVFIVRRLENDDFMVVSDINAALGLFSQELVERTIVALDTLKKCQDAAISGTAGEGVDRDLWRTCASTFAKDREKLLEPFAVQVYPIDGQEVFALIETVMEDGIGRRAVSISDFDGNALTADLEPFETRLDPVTVRKDIDKSFHESHLREVPERFRYILNVYSPMAAGGGPVIDLKTRVLRRRFGRRLEGLQRLILVGTGSAFHMAVIARCLLAELMPEIAIDTLHPGDIEDPKRHIQTNQDLVIILSWSSTTAEMVQMAQRLLIDDKLMVGVSEKCFADMALATGKSIGVMPIFSGEEVTIAGIKSTLCMLLCVNLLGAWICAEKGMAERLDPVFKCMNDLADRIEQLNDDSDVIAFSRQTAAAIAKADAIVVVCAPDDAGTGKEIALKLEEAAWYTVGKWYPFDDILGIDPSRWSRNRFAIVHATRRTHIDKALAVIHKLADAGIEFAVVTCPNRHQRLMDQLSGGRCLVLQCSGDGSQSYLDLAFYYHLALEVGLASGHGVGVGPRNRTKSSTVTRSLPKTVLSPPAELKRLAETKPASISAGEYYGDLSSFRWEDDIKAPGSAEVFAEMRRLADLLRRENLLTALGANATEDLSELGRLLFDARSEINRLAIVPLDPAAHGVVRDVSAIWRRLINLPIRELPAGEWPRRTAEDTLLLVVATASDVGHSGGEALPERSGYKIVWMGPELPSWLREGVATAGRFVLPASVRKSTSTWLYVGLNLLLAEAWFQHKPEKGAIVRRHISGAADAITAVLNDARLLTGVRDLAAANAGYRTAFIISPFAGSGRVWEEQFDNAGCLMMVHHRPGHCGHGPIVTIDGMVDKYVAMDNRIDMAARYGVAEVARWEADYLDGVNIDDFLARPPAMPLLRPRAPFYADNRWYLPVVRPDYDTHRDNLIILDLTSERDLPLMLDELSLLGSRIPRLAIITQEERIREAGEKTLFSFPVNDMLIFPSSHGGPFADLHLPIVLNAVGAALATIWKTVQAEENSISVVK